MNNLTLKIILTFTLWFIAAGVVECDKILFLLPLSTTSHKIFFEPLINALAGRGHNVSVLTNTKGSQTVPRVKEILTPLAGHPDPFEKMSQNGSQKMSFPFTFIIEGCHNVINSPPSRKLLENLDEFDLILVDSFLTGCLDGFIYKSGVPFILVTTMPAPSYISERLGNFLPPSIIPVLTFRGYVEPNGEMGVVSRLTNFVHFVLARLYVNFVILPSLENVYRGYVGENVPGIAEIESKASMVFMNSHYTMNHPRPLLPAVVEIGGMHCNKTRSPQDFDLENFISKASSPHGFIYVSFGSIIDLNNGHTDFIHTLLTTFSRLKQRVVLKLNKRDRNLVYNQTSAIKIPQNVWIGDWFSQQSILDHENIRLFISHGGLLSMQEAVYHGVPVLGVPFGMDQDTNLHTAVLQGYALKLDISSVNEETLESSIKQMLSNSRFLDNAQIISKLFRNRIASPLETAVFWTEYVMSTQKSNTTSFITSPAKNMSIFQYYSYDILAFLLLAVCVLYVMVHFIIKRALTLVRNFSSFIMRQPGINNNNNNNVVAHPVTVNKKSK